MGLFDVFKKKVEEILPVEKKWIGCADGVWEDGDHVAYNLYIDANGNRIVELSGPEAERHPTYVTAVYPWTQGAPKEILSMYLKTKDEEYWKPPVVAKPPKVKARKT